MMEVQLKSDMNLCTGTITLVFCVPAVDVDGTGWDGAGMEGTSGKTGYPFSKHLSVHFCEGRLPSSSWAWTPLSSRKALDCPTSSPLLGLPEVPCQLGILRLRTCRSFWKPWNSWLSFPAWSWRLLTSFQSTFGTSSTRPGPQPWWHLSGSVGKESRILVRN